MQNIQTLHSHTINSDGELTHLEILDICEENNITVVAFTDHDTVIDLKTLKGLRQYKGKTKWISGIEISSGLPKELGGKAVSNFHIVGLFVDPTNKALLEHCEKAKDARITRMEKMVRNLKGLGFNITEKDCLNASGGEAIGRPHVVKALISKQHNLEILEEFRKKMMKEAEVNPEVKEVYDVMMEQGERKYPYAILLSDNAYIPNIYVDYEYFVDMDKSVELIRNAGGVALLAHYYTCLKKIDENMLDGMLKDNRFDGLETTFGLSGFNTGTETEKMLIETSNLTKGLVEKYGKLKGGGVDAHKPKDFVNFSNSGKYAEETIGLAEDIIANSSVDTKWSNF